MSNDYQAIYDAVRSRIGNADIGHSIEAAMRDANISFYADQASQAIQRAAALYEAPSVMFRPTLSIDGDMWCALYGEDLMRGVAGFGKSPAAAMWDFDCNWVAKLPETVLEGERNRDVTP